jgi:hypothetical protein
MGPSLSPKVKPPYEKKGAGTLWMLSKKTAGQDIKYVLKTYSQKGKQFFILPPISKHVKWFNNNRPQEATLLKVIDAMGLPNPAIFSKICDMITEAPKNLLICLKAYNSELITENWKIPEKNTELNSHRLILLADWNLHNAINKTNCKALVI